jgi:cell wall assembly regulator SMI1
MNVAINGALIYTINDETKFPLELAPGSIWNVITIPEDAAGKMLTIDITPEPNHTMGTINRVYFGSKSAFLLHIIESRGLNLFIAFIILLISVVLIVIYLSMIRFQ